MQRIKRDTTGSDSLDDVKRSHEHLSLLTEVPINEELMKHWQKRFQELAPDSPDNEGSSIRHRFVLVDGFLMFYDKQVSDVLDVRILIRVRKDVLKARRLARNERVRSVPLITSLLPPLAVSPSLPAVSLHARRADTVILHLTSRR